MNITGISAQVTPNVRSGSKDAASTYKVPGTVSVNSGSSRINYSVLASQASGVDESPESHRIYSYLRSESILFRREYKTLKEDSRAYTSCRAATDELCNALKIDPKKIHLTIYEPIDDLKFYNSPNDQENFPEAYIFPHTGEIRVSSSLLEAINYRKDLFQSVIAHELGHYLSKHDIPFQEAKEHRFSYEEEYQADRISNIAMSKIGKKPCLIEALELIAQKDTKDEFQAWFFMSHPHLSRRSRSSARLCRNLSFPAQTDSSLIDRIHNSNWNEPNFRELRYGSENFPSFTEGPVTANSFLLASLLSQRGFNINARPKVRELLAPNSALNLRDQRINDFIASLQEEGISLDTLVSDIDPKKIKEFYSIMRTVLGPIEREMKALSLENTFENDLINAQKGSIEDQKVKAKKWWDEAASNISSSDNGPSELMSDISSYSPETCLWLIKNLDLFDHNKSQQMLFRTSSELDGFSPSHLMLTELLFERWYLACSQEGITRDHLEAAFKVLSDFYQENGVHLPSTKYYLYAAYNNLSKQNTQGNSISNLLDQYEGCIFAYESQGLAKPSFFGITSPESPHALSIERDTDYAREKRSKDEFLKTVEAFHRKTEVNLEINGLNIKVRLSPTKNEVFTTRNADGQTYLYLPSEFSGNYFMERIYAALGGESRFNLAFEGWKREYFQVLSGAHLQLKDRLNNFEKNDFPERNYFDSFPANYLKHPYRPCLRWDSMFLPDHVILSRASLVDGPEACFLMHGEQVFKERYLDTDRASKHSSRAYDSNSVSVNYFFLIQSKLFPEAKSFSELFERVPFACPERDREITRLAGFTPLDSFSDIEKFSSEILDSNNPDILLSLSRNLYNPVLSMSASNRLYDLIQNDFNHEALDLERSNIQNEMRTKNFPPELINNKALINLLLAFPYPCGKRDSSLFEMIDSSSSQRQRKFLGSFLMEPTADLIKRPDSRSFAIFETFKDFLDFADDIDKEEFLLFIIGHRSFRTAMALNSPSFFSNDSLVSIDDARSEYLQARVAQIYGQDPENMTLTSLNCPEVKEPDSFLWLIELMGYSPEAFSKRGLDLFSSKEQEDLLAEFLIGRNGILYSDRAEKFLEASARTIVNQSHIDFSDMKETAIDFLTIALKSCPKEKLPRLFLEFWKISREKEASLPKFVGGLLSAYGVATTKFGQFLSTQKLPADWRDEFRALCDSNRVFDPLMLDLYADHAFQGKSPFLDFGEKLGEGSMAATFSAIKAAANNAELFQGDGGNKRAVKVFIPFIERELEDDLKFISQLVSFINDHSSELGFSLPKDTAETLGKRIRAELDINTEISGNSNLRETLERARSYRLNIPYRLAKVYPEESRQSFLSMDLLDSISLDAPNHTLEAISPDEILNAKSNLVLAILYGIFNGHYQKDANPGNFGLEIDPQGHRHKVVFYDWASVGSLGPENRELLKNILLASQRPYLIASSRANKLSGLLAQTIVTDNQSALASKLQVDEGLDLKRKRNFPEFFRDFVAFTETHGYELKDQWRSLVDTLALMRPLFEELADDKDFLSKATSIFLTS